MDTNRKVYSKSTQVRSVLYASPWLFHGSTAMSRVVAMRDLVDVVDTFDTEPRELMHNAGALYYRIARQLFRRGVPIRERPDIADANRRVLEMVRAKPYDVLWLDKVLVLEPDTLAQVRRIQPRILIIGYSPDNMVERHNQSLQFLRSLPLYDLYFTTKFNKVDELRALGCPRVVFTDTSFNPALHRPIPLTPDEKRTLGGPVGFVGTAEKERAISVAFLADQGVPVRVWGNEWPRWKDRLHARFEVCGPSQMGDMYVRLLNAFDINLGFLRKANFDQQTCRSMEIPACGKFMLAERTEEHRRLFEEGKEAEFFASDHELLEKARYYTAHVTERERIAAAGLARVWKDGYCYQDRLAKMLDHVAALMQK